MTSHQKRLTVPKGYCNQCGKLECQCPTSNALVDASISTLISILGAIR